MAAIRIIAGFLPLLDSLLLVVAREKGFASAEGIDLVLVRESSWANIRDRVAVGHFDVAHMLGPMPIASNLGLAPIDVPLLAPMTLGLGGNAITVSNELWRRMEASGAPAGIDPTAAGAALRSVIAARAGKPRFAVTHPYSGHSYELRYWLAASGIVPDIDIDITILPPPLMTDALAQGAIDGYCVGEPYNSAAVASGVGRIVTTKSRIWPHSPDKVLGVTASWASRNRDALAALLRALHAASVWCGDPAHHGMAAAILGDPIYLDRPADLLRRSFTGRLELGNGTLADVPDFFEPLGRAATYPWHGWGLWYYSQMVRWNQVPHSAKNARLAAETYRPDLYRAALGAALPGGGAEEAPSMEFFDRSTFDPVTLEAYIAGQQSA